MDVAINVWKVDGRVERKTDSGMWVFGRMDRLGDAWACSHYLRVDRCVDVRMDGWINELVCGELDG